MKKIKWTPTIAQANFVDALLSGLKIREAAEMANCSRDSYYKTWRHSTDFMQYLEEQRRSKAAVKLPQVDKALFEAAQKGDIAACRLVYELFGNLRTGVQINNNSFKLPEGQPGSKVLIMLEQIEKRGLNAKPGTTISLPSTS